MLVVEDDEAARLIDSGCWFGSPAEAEEQRLKIEKECNPENKKEIRPKDKQKGKSNER